jgi:hypothetical protein
MKLIGIAELEKIVGGADKSPVGAHLFAAPQQELAESARLFDLSKHRLGRRRQREIDARAARCQPKRGVKGLSR